MDGFQDADFLPLTPTWIDSLRLFAENKTPFTINNFRFSRTHELSLGLFLAGVVFENPDGLEHYTITAFERSLALHVPVGHAAITFYHCNNEVETQGSIIARLDQARILQVREDFISYTPTFQNVGGQLEVTYEPRRPDNWNTYQNFLRHYGFPVGEPPPEPLFEVPDMSDQNEPPSPPSRSPVNSGRLTPQARQIHGVIEVDIGAVNVDYRKPELARRYVLGPDMKELRVDPKILVFEQPPLRGYMRYEDGLIDELRGVINWDTYPRAELEGDVGPDVSPPHDSLAQGLVRELLMYFQYPAKITTSFHHFNNMRSHINTGRMDLDHTTTHPGPRDPVAIDQLTDIIDTINVAMVKLRTVEEVHGSLEHALGMILRYRGVVITLTADVINNFTRMHGEVMMRSIVTLIHTLQEQLNQGLRHEGDALCIWLTMMAFCEGMVDYHIHPQFSDVRTPLSGLGLLCLGLGVREWSLT
jgi:hypothetical protein